MKGRQIQWKKSKGEYFVDSNGNTVLDMNASANGMVLGYNNDDLVNSRMTEVYDRFVTHKTPASSLPTHDLADIIRENVMVAAP